MFLDEFKNHNLKNAVYESDYFLAFYLAFFSSYDGTEWDFTQKILHKGTVHFIRRQNPIGSLL